MLAPVLLVARVEFDVAVAGSLVLEQPHAVIAPERHLLAVCLFSHHQFHLMSFHFIPIINHIFFFIIMIIIITYQYFIHFIINLD